MWVTCHKCNGDGFINKNICIHCYQYQLYFYNTIIFRGHIWCDDNFDPITPPSSPRELD